MRCIVRFCGRNVYWTTHDGPDGEISTHRFPMNHVRAKQWLTVLAPHLDQGEQEDIESMILDGNSARICSAHFQESDFITCTSGKRKLHYKAVPSIFPMNDERSERSRKKIPSTGHTNRTDRVPFQNIGNFTLGGKLAVSRTSEHSLLIQRNQHSNVYPEFFKSSVVQRNDASINHLIALPNDTDISEKTIHFSSFRHSQSTAVPGGTHDAYDSTWMQHTDSLQTRVPYSSIALSGINTEVNCKGSDEQSTVNDQPNGGLREEPAGKRLRYAGDIKDLSKITPKQAVEVLPRVHQQLQDAKKRVNSLKVQKHRLQKKINGFEEILNKLKELKLLSDKGEILVQNYGRNEELVKEIVSGHAGRPYSTELRQFALTLHFYSAKAYNFVRQSFNNTLPHESTIVRWYRSIDGSPGLTSEALAILEQKAEQMKLEGRPLLACLTMDEVAIRQQIQWNPHIKKFEGVVDYGNSFEFLNNSDDLIVAKEALVFVVSSVDETWKIPVAYFLITGLKAEDKKILVTNVLIALEAAKVKIIGFTFDGTSANIATANSLGCNLRPNEELRTCFFHPTSGHPVFVLLDACHMLKLIRNMFSSLGTLKTMHGDARWEFIRQLNELQNLTDFKLAGRLTDKHISYQNQKMKVLLAAQTLSQSVADALALLMHRDLAFAGAGPTVEFISIINDIFDALNSKNRSADGFKKPLCETNFDVLNVAFEFAEKYISSIKLSTGQSILKSQYKTGFLGFLIDIKSFREMFDQYVRNEKVLTSLPTYRFSQDHVETLFAAIRAKGGTNNNPNVTQFKAAYKRLLCHNNVTISNKANCLDFNQSTMLTAEGPEEHRSHLLARLNPRSVDNDEQLQTINDNLLQELPFSRDFVDDEFVGAATADGSRRVQKEIMRDLKCKKCLAVILDDEMEAYCSKNLITICRIVEMEFKILVVGKNDLNVAKYFEVLITCSMLRIQNEFPQIFENMTNHIVQDNDATENHRGDLIKLIITCYLNNRLTQYSKHVQPFRQSTRSKLTKLILFEGH